MTAQKKNLVCFQELWGVGIGQSALQDPKLIEKELLDSVQALKQGLDYFKEFRQSSVDSFTKKSNKSENEVKFISKSAKFLNVDCDQLDKIFDHFSKSYFRGSKEKLQQMLNEEKNSQLLLSEISNHYFVERLFLLRCISPIFGYFQDESHPLHKVYAEVLRNLPEIISTLQKQLETSFKAKPPSTSTRGPSCTSEMATRLSMQQVKEQCEVLELIFLYHSQYGMPSEKLLKLANLFKEYGFGVDHPLLEVVDPVLLTPLLSSMNALQQIILIEGLDMDLLQESDAADEHNLSKNNEAFENIDDIVKSIVDQQELSPLVLSWATVRHLLLDDHGGVVTQKLGDRAIANQVWKHMAHLVATYPFDTESNVSLVAKRVLRDVLSCVTRTFHEDTLGDYADLISIATLLLGDSAKHGGHGIQNCGLDMLLLSSSGYFPLNIEPMLNLLTCMVKSQADCLQVHAFIANLPKFAEYLVTCARDEVESLEDDSVWRLLTTKPIRTAGGLHTIRIPVGTIGHLADSQYGAMVQWHRTINGWNVFNAELESLLKYQGPSCNMELLGYFKKAELIYQLIENILIHMDGGVHRDTGYMAVLETMEMFVAKIHTIIQRVIQTTSPPIKLIQMCVRCATAWLKINPELTASMVVAQFAQIQYFPSKNHVSFNLPQSNATLHPGIYGSLLAECERVNGCFHITVATVDLVIALLECSLGRDESIISTLSHSVEFLLTEVFASYQRWQKSDLETWDKIGVRCLEMCHIILCSSTNVNITPQADKVLQKIVLSILSCSDVADVLLKLICVNVDSLHALIANEPSSKVVGRIIETIRLGFSLLNNLLRIESSFIPSNELEQSYLHEVLATPSVGENNLISIVAGYLYHRQNLALPRLSVALLRRISLVAPMSLHACLGSDVVAIRDILLTRLQGRTEDNSLKIGILELFVVSVQTQPGLLELFLDLEPVNKDKPEMGLTLGKYSCLSVVLDMMKPIKQGTYLLPPRLHTACVKLLNALWVDRRHSALQAVRSTSANKGLGFWSSLLFPLFCENSPRDVAQNELLETSAHVFNIVALERFYTSRGNSDESLDKVMKEFSDKKRFEHWSKVLLCVTKTLLTSKQFERRHHQMFASAWKSFLSTIKITNLTLVEKIIDDIVTSILFLVDGTDDCSDVITMLDLLSSLLLTLVYKQTKDKKKMADVTPFLPRIVSCIQKIYENVKFKRISTHLHAVSLHIIINSNNSDSNKKDGMSPSDDLVHITCQHLNLLLRDVNKDLSTVETPLLLIRTLEVLFEVDGKIHPSWLSSVSRESTVNVLMTVLMKMLVSCHDKSGLRVSTAILRLLTRISIHETTSRMIKNTNQMSELCLNITNTYNNNKTNKKWLDVYHLSLVLMSRMISSLSHDFIDDTLDFLGVHQDRIIQCLSAIRINQSPSLLREASHTMELLAALSRDFTHYWRFKLRHSFECAVMHVSVTCHSCVAMLLHPRLLHESMKLREKKEVPTKITSTPTRALSMRQSSSISLPKPGDDESLPPEVAAVQQSLVSILGNCLDFLKNLSPNICQILFDQGIDSEEYNQLLTTNFNTPSSDQDIEASFGTIISAANIALSTLHKIDANDVKQMTYHDALTFVADSALTLVMSQCLLLLKQSQVSHRRKQLLKRELADELNSCVRSASRHLRHSSSSYSPQSSPIHSQPVQAGFSRSPATTSSKGILDLVSAFVKQLMR